MSALETLFHEAPPGGADLNAVLGLIGQELFHYARVITGGMDTAEDAVQDTLVALLQQRGAVREINEPRAWLFTVLRRKALTYRTKETPLAKALVASVDGDPTERLILEEALETLSEPEQEVVLLHVWEGLTFEEIAQVLSIPRNSALSRYRRSIKELQHRLGEPLSGPPQPAALTEMSRL